MNAFLRVSTPIGRTLMVVVVLLAAFVPRSVLRAATDAPHAWAANQRLFGDLGVSVQSEPAIAAANGQSITIWTDERNTQPDIYAKASNSSADEQVSDEQERGMRYDNAPDVVIDAAGRAFAVYSTQDDIVLARRDAGSTQWLSRTLMSVGNETWYSDARRPALVLAGNTLVVVWQDYRARDWDIYSARCDPNAMTCEANIKVSDATDASWQVKPRIAAAGAGAGVLAVWEDDREGDSAPHIYGSYSADSGATWGASGRIDVGADPATNPAIAFDGVAAPWVVWERHLNGDLNTAPDIYVAKFDGAAWALQQRVDGAAAGKRALNPRVAAGAGGVFVAWEDYRAGNIAPRTYVAQLNNTTWQESEVEEHSGAQTRPALAMDGSNVQVAWQDTRNGQPDIFSASWNGSAWANVAQVNENANRMAKQYHPNLVAAGNGDLYLTWLDARTYTIKPYMSHYIYAANAWSEPLALPTDGAGRYDVLLDNVSSALDSAGNLHVLWSQGSDLGVNIFHSQYNGSGWSGVLQASDATTSTTYRPRMQPALAIRGNVIAATWVEWETSAGWPYPTRILAAKFDGAQWQQTVVSQGQIQGDPKPSISVDDGGNVYVAWSDQRWIDDGLRGDVVVARQAAGQDGWSVPVRVNESPSTLNYCFNERPRLQAVGDVVHITWSACVPWTDNVFYSSSSDGGATWATPQRLAMVGTDSMQPSLAINGNEVSVMYASKANSASFVFNEAHLSAGQWFTDTPISDGPSAWNVDEDGAPSIVYDVGSQGYVAAWVDHRLRDVPQIYFSKTGGTFVATSFLYMPLSRK